MRRLKDYLGFVAWQSGLGYLALWAVTLWSLDWGPAVFERIGHCQVDSAKVMFYWVCDPGQPLGILAALANTALTVTVWAPVYVAAATVRPEDIAIAAPIICAHVVGLPTAIFVSIRLMLKLFDGVRRAALSLAGRSAEIDAADAAALGAGASADGPVTAPPRPRVRPSVPPREHFGLRDVRPR